MVSTRRDFGNANVTVTLEVGRPTLRTVPGLRQRTHLGGLPERVRAVRGQLDRRDNTMIIKKKCQGGSDNGGTYYYLTGNVPARHPLPILAKRERVGAGPTRRLGEDHRPATASPSSPTDGGVGCAPLRGGGVGIRGDNAELRFARIVVLASGRDVKHVWNRRCSCKRNRPLRSRRSRPCGSDEGGAGPPR